MNGGGNYNPCGCFPGRNPRVKLYMHRSLQVFQNLCVMTRREERVNSCNIILQYKLGSTCKAIISC